jgi:hypothetical protein
MAAQGRKNVHGKTGVRFRTAYKPEKNKGMLRDVVSELIAHDKVEVTSGVTKDLITLASRSRRLREERRHRPVVWRLAVCPSDHRGRKGTTVLRSSST